MAFLWNRSKQLGPGGWGRSILWPSEWLAEAGASDEPLRIGSGRVLPPPTHDGTPPTAERNPVPWTARLIIDLIGSRLMNHGRVTFLAPNRLIWFERKNGKRRTTRSWFVRETSGLVRWMGTSGLRDNGMRALEFAAHRRTLGSLARVVEQCPREPVSLGDMKREFHSVFPDGVIYDPTLPIPDALRKMDGRERRRILFAAGAYLKTLRPWSLGSRYEVTALSAHGELSLIFITRGWGERRARRQWLSRLRQYNVRAGLWGAV